MRMPNVCARNVQDLQDVRLVRQSNVLHDVLQRDWIESFITTGALPAGPDKCVLHKKKLQVTQS